MKKKRKLPAIELPPLRRIIRDKMPNDNKTGNEVEIKIIDGKLKK